MTTLVLGAEGKQCVCYTNVKNATTPPKAPGGGGFGCEQFSLESLYTDFLFRKNVWTKTNILKDLCRFLYCKVTFYRHPETDFIVAYHRQPPFEISKDIYTMCHPVNMLLAKHKIIIPSKFTNPKGKSKIKKHIKPPKQMLTKWFFSKQFSDFGLLLLSGSALNLRYSHLSASNENLLINITSLNPKFYQHTNWAAAHAHTSPYKPYDNISSALQYKAYVREGGKLVEKTFNLPDRITTDADVAISYDKGWFSSPILKAIEWTVKPIPQAIRNIIYGRYNPTRDKGTGNKIYIISILADTWNSPTHDKQVVLEDLPLWLGVYGYISYLQTIKPDDWLASSIVVLVSEAIYCYNMIGACTMWAPIDGEYIDGKKPYDLPITQLEKTKWYPNYKWQLKTLNSIVESGPFVPQYSEEKYSTWELKYHYDFCFKWGGPAMPEKDVKNPKDLRIYDVPDKQLGRIQICNPAKQSTETIFHPWDSRRGLIKEKALKRMCQHLETDTEFECSSEEGAPPKKKERQGAALQNPYQEEEEIQQCLQTLCKENTCQEETQEVQQLIKQQQDHQQQLKYHILKLLIDLKTKQRQLQLHTGMVE